MNQNEIQFAAAICTSRLLSTASGDGETILIVRGICCVGTLVILEFAKRYHENCHVDKYFLLTQTSQQRCFG